MSHLLKVSLACLVAASGTAQADVRYDLSAHVQERCGIGRVNISNGQQPTVVVHSNCNASAFRLTFVDLPQTGLIKSVDGTASDAQILDRAVSLTPRRPGSQTTVIHFVRGVEPGLLERIVLEAY